MRLRLGTTFAMVYLLMWNVKTYVLKRNVLLLSLPLQLTLSLSLSMSSPARFVVSCTNAQLHILCMLRVFESRHVVVDGAQIMFHFVNAFYLSLPACLNPTLLHARHFWLLFSALVTQFFIYISPFCANFLPRFIWIC